MRSSEKIIEASFPFNSKFYKLGVPHSQKSQIAHVQAFRRINIKAHVNSKTSYLFSLSKMCHEHCPIKIETLSSTVLLNFREK